MRGELLEQVGLDARLDHRPGELSAARSSAGCRARPQPDTFERAMPAEQTVLDTAADLVRRGPVQPKNR